MSTSFSISRSRCSALSDSTLRAEIHSHTGSDDETSSILRSLQRFGEDPSISYYEVSSTTLRGARHAAPRSAWTVRAMR